LPAQLLPTRSCAGSCFDESIRCCNQNVDLGVFGKWARGSPECNTKSRFRCGKRLLKLCSISFRKIDCVRGGKEFRQVRLPLLKSQQWHARESERRRAGLPVASTLVICD
jgi:hypothetical protein